MEQSSKPSSSSSTNIEVVQPGRVFRPPAWAKVIGRMCALRPCYREMHDHRMRRNSVEIRKGSVDVTRGITASQKVLSPFSHGGVGGGGTCFLRSSRRTTYCFSSSLQATSSRFYALTMLALAPQPMHTPVDVPHRTQPPTPSSSARPPFRKVTPSYSSSSSSSSHSAHSGHSASHSGPREAPSTSRRTTPQRTPSFVSARVFDGRDDDPSTPPGSESEDNEPEPSIRPSVAPVDIHAYDSSTLLRLLATTLTEIASMNTDRDHTEPYLSSSVHSHSTSSEPHPPIWRKLTTASRHALATASSLSFHARNVPTIALEAYLTRIQKYCPASNEVFLSLLVYFDRMMKLAKEACGKVFAIDMYNVHRLVIAGVTVASKFFSDVFYTNSRYAKVSFGTTTS